MLNNLNTEVSRNDISNLSTTDDYKLGRSKIEHTRLISETKSFCRNTCFFNVVTPNNTMLLIKRKEKKKGLDRGGVRINKLYSALGPIRFGFKTGVFLHKYCSNLSLN